MRNPLKRAPQPALSERHNVARASSICSHLDERISFAFLCCFTFLIAAPNPLRAATSVTIATVDETTLKGTLSSLENGKLLLDSPTAKVALEDVVEFTPKAGPVAPNTTLRKLTGKIIGTEGSYENEGNTRDKVFDSDLDTFFDAPQPLPSSPWVGLDLGAPRAITLIKYAPRPDRNLAYRIVGGKFQGSNTADFSSGVVDLFTVTAVPPLKQLTQQSIPTANLFRYVRYTNVEASCNIAEIEFWGKDPVAPTVRPTTAPRPPAASSAPTAAVAPSTQRAKSWKILLIGDDTLTAPLAAWTDQKLTLSHPLATGGSLDIPLNQVRELWAGTGDQIKQAHALKLDPGVEDTAFVAKDGGVVGVRGVAIGIKADSLLFKFNDEQKKINLAKIVGVILGGQEVKRDDTFRQTILLGGGDSLSGTWKSYDPAANLLGLETRWGAGLSIPFDQVTRIRSTHGRLVYLGDLKPAAVEQVPYFDRLLPYRVDQSLTGGPLKLSDGEYPRGIAVHSRTVLTYDIAGNYSNFKTKVGFQQPEGKIGQAIIRVLGDDKILHEDLDARGDAKPIDLDLKITGVKRLTLEVDFGKNEDTGDRIVWANARLLKAKK